jgi:predicted small secreted protein
MRKILKVSMGALVGMAVAVSVRTLYQKRKDQNQRKLLELAKHHFMFDDILTSWLMTEPSRSRVHEGGVVRADGTVVTFEIDAESLKIVEIFESVEKVGTSNDHS